MRNFGDNTNTSKFMITFDRTGNLDGYNNPIGELVEGEHILTAIEASMQRVGAAKDDIVISSCGTK